MVLVPHAGKRPQAADSKETSLSFGGGGSVRLYTRYAPVWWVGNVRKDGEDDEIGYELAWFPLLKKVTKARQKHATSPTHPPSSPSIPQNVLERMPIRSFIQGMVTDKPSRVFRGRVLLKARAPGITKRLTKRIRGRLPTIQLVLFQTKIHGMAKNLGLVVINLVRVRRTLVGRRIWHGALARNLVERPAPSLPHHAIARHPGGASVPLALCKGHGHLASLEMAKKVCGGLAAAVGARHGQATIYGIPLDVGKGIVHIDIRRRLLVGWEDVLW
jgi:hypothetical protein